MLKLIATNLWVAEQPLKYFGLEVGTRMTILRLNNGELMVISSIQPATEMVDDLNQLGQISYIIAPNLYHHLFITPFQERYPNAELWATAGLKQKRPDLTIAQVLGNATGYLPDGIATLPVLGFNTLAVRGPTPLEEWVFFHPATRTLILTDLAFHFDTQSSRTAQILTQLLGGYQQLRPSPLEKIATRDKAAVRESIRQILKWDFDRVIVAHGSIVERDGKRQFQSGYEWFLGTSL